MKRRMFASLLSAALLVQSLGVFPASAEETNSVQNFVYDDYEVSYQVTNSWGDTEVVSITLSNTGDSTIEDWMLYFDPNGEVQYTTDCQQLTTSDGISYFKNSGYNADVAPDSSVTFSNRQDPNYTHTIVLTASDLTEGFNSFATIYYDTDTQSYVTSTSY